MLTCGNLQWRQTANERLNSPDRTWNSFNTKQRYKNFLLFIRHLQGVKGQAAFLSITLFCPWFPKRELKVEQNLCDWKSFKKKKGASISKDVFENACQPHRPCNSVYAAKRLNNWSSLLLLLYLLSQVGPFPFYYESTPPNLYG